MKNPVTWLQSILLLAVVILLGAFIFKPAAAPPPAKRKTVVVELFTSEGCSSCPPADALLSRMGQQASSNGAEIIPLGFHVDYWDHQGWRDRFSSHAYTERQEQYASRFKIEGPYTPQMVVDGATEFVGNDSSRAQQAVAEAAAEPEQAVISLLGTEPGRIKVRVTSSSLEPADVLLAITEDNLMSKVGAGENDGRELHHSAVVRELRVLGQMKDGRFEPGPFAFTLPKDIQIKNLHCVVFVQQPSNGKILAAVSKPVNSLPAGK